jgi:hypothetical protein
VRKEHEAQVMAITHSTTSPHPQNGCRRLACVGGRPKLFSGPAPDESDESCQTSLMSDGFADNSNVRNAQSNKIEPFVSVLARYYKRLAKTLQQDPSLPHSLSAWTPNLLATSCMGWHPLEIHRHLKAGCGAWTRVQHPCVRRRS